MAHKPNHKAEEEASIERANLVQQEKLKIAALYERKYKQLATQKKMYFLLFVRTLLSRRP